MKQCNCCKQNKPLSEFYADKKKPDGLYLKCKFCHRSATERWRLKNMTVAAAVAARYRERHPERVKKSQSRSNAKAYRANPEKFKARTKAYVEANTEKVSAYHRRRRAEQDPLSAKQYFAEYYQRNAERLKKRAKLLGPVWARANPDKVLARANRHRAAKLRALPSWADPVAIEKIYAEPVAITTETGKPHHVDHIVPLQGKIVSGLRVHNNLQILPGRENQSKGARHWPDMP